MVSLRFVAVMLVACNAAWASEPRLFFSDVVSGPKTGNSDTSLGQTANTDGIIVTVWGVNLGTSPSSVRVNGVEARVYSWGDATAPANLFERHHMQMISFQVMHDTPNTGDGITAVVDGRTSNALPFAIRSTGTIRFVATSGSDSNPGTWAMPMASIQEATNAMAAGDVTYVRDGVSKRTNCETYNACVNVFTDGTPELPMALIAYPGATVTLGAAGVARALGSFNVGTSAGSTHWVISKLSVLDAAGLALPANSGWRLVGNFITMPHGDGSSGAIYVGGNHVKVLGNELTGLANENPTASKLFHTIYASGDRTSSAPRLPTELDREIGWNSLHDNRNNRGINIYSEQAYSALIQGHRVHDNFIINQRGVGILMGGYVTADNWVYNNVIDQAGLGPDWAQEGVSGHVCMQINVGADTTPATPTRLFVFNNSLSRCGYGPTETPDPANIGSSGALSFGDIFDHATVLFRNNIVFSEGTPYVSPWSVNVPPASGYTNAWFGRGPSPAWDTGGLSQDPKWVSLATHDLRLTASSPAIDVGVEVPESMVLDVNAVSRPQGAGVDLGAFEFEAGDSGTTSTVDAGFVRDAGVVDAGSQIDAGVVAPVDAGTVRDAGGVAAPADGGVARADAGAARDDEAVVGCGCQEIPASSALLALVAAAFLRRSRLQ